MAVVATTATDGDGRNGARRAASAAHSWSAADLRPAADQMQSDTARKWHPESIDMGAAHSAVSPASSSTSAIVVSWPPVSPGTAQETSASPGDAESTPVDPRTQASRCSCGPGQPTSVLTDAVSSARPFLASAKNIDVFGFV